MKQYEYKIGIVGFGGMGNWHRETIGTIDRIQVAGVFDIDEARMSYAKECKLNTYNSLEDMLADESIDLVLVSTPNHVHKSIAIQAMRAGKHVICEKPVTMNSNDLSEMMMVAEETGRFLTVHQNRRWDEDFLTMKEVFESKKLGEIYRIESRVHGSRGIPGDWRQEKEYGGGMVLDWGVHLLDQILMLMGDTKLKKVYATITNITNQVVDDGFTAHLEFENGPQAIVEVGTSNFISLPRWYMLGQNGTAIIEDWNMDGRMVRAVGKSETDIVPVRTAAGITKTMAPRRDDTISKEKLPLVKSDVRDFYHNVINVLDGKEESKINLPEVMRVMRLMEAIFASARDRNIIDFE
ncbi:MAG: Gfo/Idh/MocA family oxidoreductase [Anaerolineaceae bacterium]|nr:MAG: Gfo/Idh/MocA family oxidoreductase [Anaerolineaceae bacterium]